MDVRCEFQITCVLKTCVSRGICIGSLVTEKDKDWAKTFAQSGFVDKPIPVVDKPILTKKKKEPKPVVPTMKSLRLTVDQYAGVTFYSDKSTCFYCGSVLMGSGYRTCPDIHYPTKDHVLPKVRGGKNAGNIVWACKCCNTDKGSMLLHHWLRKIVSKWPQNDRKDIAIRTVTSMISKIQNR